MLASLRLSGTRPSSPMKARSSNWQPRFSRAFTRNASNAPSTLDCWSDIPLAGACSFLIGAVRFSTESRGFEVKCSRPSSRSSGRSSKRTTVATLRSPSRALPSTARPLPTSNPSRHVGSWYLDQLLVSSTLPTMATTAKASISRRAMYVLTTKVKGQLSLP